MRSPYYLAWFVANRLKEPDPRTGFLLLARGLWNDTKRTFADPSYLSNFATEGEAAIPQLSKGDQPFYWALVAFAQIHAGRRDVAGAIVESLTNEARGDSAFLARYLDAISACLADPASLICDPDTPIPKK